MQLSSLIRLIIRALLVAIVWCDAALFKAVVALKHRRSTPNLTNIESCAIVGNFGIPHHENFSSEEAGSQILLIERLQIKAVRRFRYAANTNDCGGLMLSFKVGAN